MAPTDHDEEPPWRGFLRATVEGSLVGGLVAFGGLSGDSLLFVAFLAPVTGGMVAGFRSPGGHLVAASAGFLVGVVLGVGTVAVFLGALADAGPYGGASGGGLGAVIVVVFGIAIAHVILATIAAGLVGGSDREEGDGTSGEAQPEVGGDGASVGPSVRGRR